LQRKGGTGRFSSLEYISHATIVGDIIAGNYASAPIRIVGTRPGADCDECLCSGSKLTGRGFVMNAADGPKEN
jgi:hypothetical protein